MFQTAHAHGYRVGCHYGSEQSHSLVPIQSACAGTPFDELREGQMVSFTVGQGPKGPCAENVAVR
jgi:'Cold-shock' DNA-binding domain